MSSGLVDAPLPVLLSQLGVRFGSITRYDDAHFKVFLRTTDAELFAGVRGVDLLIPATPPHLPLIVVPACSPLDASRGPSLPPALIDALNVILLHPHNAAPPLRRRLLYLENNLSLLLKEISLLQAEAVEPTKTPLCEPVTASVGLQHNEDLRALLTCAWTQEEQYGLEAALSSAKGSQLKLPLFWTGVAERLHSSKSAEQCLARYLVLRRIISDSFPKSAESVLLREIAAPAAISSKEIAAGHGHFVGTRTVLLSKHQQPDFIHVAGSVQRSTANERVSLTQLDEALPVLIQAAAPCRQQRTASGLIVEKGDAGEEDVDDLLGLRGDRTRGGRR